MSKNRKKFSVALICGGPSLERGISLNSARSVLDHLQDETIEIVPFYFDPNRKTYKISKSQLYSNTPSDFDFKLKKNAESLSQELFIRELKKCDIAFPVMHGLMGEDGEIQELFEKNNIPFIASPSSACKIAYNKFDANTFLNKNGLFTLPSLQLSKKYKKNVVSDFFKKYDIKKAIVKPATGGSSIGVCVAYTSNDVHASAQNIFKKGIDTKVVIEPFAKGREFTVIVVGNQKQNPVSLVPIEIEISYKDNAVFDFRKKYLPTHGTTYHQPPRFSDEIVVEIQKQAERIFKLVGMRDFARLDGWLLDSGEIWFSDINPISGMEQNSFLFQSGARVGFSHRDILRYIVRTACVRYGIAFPKQRRTSHKRKLVNVIFGGSTSERQVSLMSGTNVWLKLRGSKIYEPKPYILDFKNNVWELPYSCILSHTVEEILATVENATRIENKLKFFRKRIHKKLGLIKGDASEIFFLPKMQTLQNFIKKSPFVFIGLHGGAGEDGTLQALLEKLSVRYNGPSSLISHICMDKFITGEKIRDLRIDGVYTAKQQIVEINKIKNTVVLWKRLCLNLGSKTLIVKPRGDGCSSGIVRLFNAKDLASYVSFAKRGVTTIPAGTFKNQKEIIDMPHKKVSELLFENFVETDKITVDGVRLHHVKRTGWLEVTVGVVSKGIDINVMNPSLTVAEGEVLSVEEKFQGGTGVNITPPPEDVISKRILDKIKQRIGAVAKGVGITGYSRIDAFVNCKTGEVLVIEINTLPGLTPSTVIYHQALAEPKPLFPTQFLESIIKNKGY